jgi:hypothetical protein
VDIPK